MKYLIIISFVFFGYHSFSQQISPEVIASAGDQFENGEVSLSWTLGEPVISTFESDYILTQGFHQDFYIITAVDDIKIDQMSVEIFPNPTANFLNIKWKLQKQEKVNIQLLDMNGKVLIQNGFQTQSASMILNLQSYERSSYFLRIVAGGQSKTYKIIKS
jgi:hypothetical protein